MRTDYIANEVALDYNAGFTGALARMYQQFGGEPSTKSIALQAHNGQYVCAEGGGGREVVANRNTLSDWETFELFELGEGKIALRAHNQQYLCAEGGGGREVVANRNTLSDWETFEIISV